MGHRASGLAAAAAGVLWAALAVLINLAVEEDDPLAAEYLTLVRLLPLRFLLALAAVHGLYRLHGGTARIGYALAGCGLAAATAVGVIRDWALNYQYFVLTELLSIAGHAAAGLGLLVLGAAALAGHRLRVGARPAPALLGLLLLLAGYQSLASLLWFPSPRWPGAQLGVVPGLLLGAAWLALAAGLLAAPAPAPAPDRPPRPSWRVVVRSLATVGTLVSGALAVALWSLGWDPAVGVLLVLLLYVHELGHVFFAHWRAIPIRGAPFFIPGFGAFVRHGGIERPWDDVWVSLGGPIVGAAAALAAKAVGRDAGLPALAYAGHLALFLNLLNLIPLAPLDGGRVALRVGRPGLLITLPAAAYVLYAGFGLFYTVLAAFGAFLALTAARRRTGTPWPDRFGIAAVYATLVLVLGTAWLASGPVRWPGVRLPAWQGALENVVAVVVVAVVASTLLLPRAWRPRRSARARYLIAALVGWPRYLLGQPWNIPITWLAAAETIGLPGLRLLADLARALAARGSRSAGFAVGVGFDVLHRLGRPDADAWLERLWPDLVAGGPELLVALHGQLAALGHRATANRLLTERLGDAPADALPPAIANELAWSLLLAGDPARALAPARAAVAAEPENAASLDTLGQVELALGDAAAAELHLRRALSVLDRSGTRVALARALAVQSRYAEALAEAARALAKPVGIRADEEPREPEVRRWIDEWRTLADRSLQDPL